LEILIDRVRLFSSASAVHVEGLAFWLSPLPLFRMQRCKAHIATQGSAAKRTGSAPAATSQLQLRAAPPINVAAPKANQSQRLLQSELPRPQLADSARAVTAFELAITISLVLHSPPAQRSALFRGGHAILIVSSSAARPGLQVHGYVKPARLFPAGRPGEKAMEVRMKALLVGDRCDPTSYMVFFRLKVS
jgi:hypothetical protein